MPRVLTVDDSRAIRSIITRQLGQQGFEVDEAEDGEQGLMRLEECSYDLVLLDVTMPVMDGPGMLKEMRDRGDKTPVLMLTSESKRSVVAEVMKAGIEDYILKPFKPEELQGKVMKILNTEATPAAGAAANEAASVTAGPSGEHGRQFIDLLVVDDMENVAKKLRSMAPERLTLNSSVSASAGLGLCRERVYRVIFVDFDLPDVKVSVLVGQLRTLQPHAALVSLALRNSAATREDMLGIGFDAVLHKPFDPDELQDLLLRFFDNQELVVVEDNMVKIGAYRGKDDRMQRYFSTVGELVEKQMENIAAACFEDVILDLSDAPQGEGATDQAARMIASVQKVGRRMGVALRVVGPADMKKGLMSFSETASLPFFETVAAAKEDL